MRADQVLIEPVLTEKTNLFRVGESKKYVFKIHPDANKAMVMSAVKTMFSVNPVACNVIKLKGKKKNVSSKGGHKRGMGQTGGWKKAIVTLTAGEKIDIFEGA